MKAYLESLLPFRWILIASIIACTAYIIFAGFEYDKDQRIFVDGYQWLWQMGNIAYWILCDILFGIGQVGRIGRWLYLKLSDCDGMCDHCDIELKEKCEEYKSK